jgi:predicted ATPase with chaperone activity
MPCLISKLWKNRNTRRAPGAALLSKAAETLALSARAYHPTLKAARTIADLDGATAVRRNPCGRSAQPETAMGRRGRRFGESFLTSRAA